MFITLLILSTLVFGFLWLRGVNKRQHFENLYYDLRAEYKALSKMNDDAQRTIRLQQDQLDIMRARIANAGKSESGTLRVTKVLGINN